MLLGSRTSCDLKDIPYEQAGDVSVHNLWEAGPVVQWLSLHVPLLGGPGFAGSDPGVDNAPLGMPCCGRQPTYKVEEDGHGC